MKTFLTVALLLIVAMALLAQSPVPTYSHANFPYSKTLMGISGKQTAGCACALGDAPGAKKMWVSPTSVPNAKVNMPITIGYDASLICNKQGITNVNGVKEPWGDQPDIPNLDLASADWQVGDVQSLPREWGEITLPGYTQTGTYTLTIKTHLRCVDVPNQSAGTGCNKYGYNECVTTATIPITVK
jgi:hypothetical protein